MAQRMGIEHSDQVAAVACAAGRYEVYQTGNNTIVPTPKNPISVLVLQGDKDPVVDYCGATGKHYWGENVISWTLPSSDVSIGYWRTVDGCPANAQLLCTNGSPTPGVMGLDSNCNGLEVKFVREPGVGHTWPVGGESTVMNFFLAHER